MEKYRENRGLCHAGVYVHIWFNILLLIKHFSFSFWIYPVRAFDKQKHKIPQPVFGLSFGVIGAGKSWLHLRHCCAA